MMDKKTLDETLEEVYHASEYTDYEAFMGGANTLLKVLYNEDPHNDDSCNDSIVENGKKAPYGYRYLMIYTTTSDEKYRICSEYESFPGARTDIKEITYIGLLPISLLEKMGWDRKKGWKE